MQSIHVQEGLRYFYKSLKRKLFGPKKYEGTAAQVCKQIIRDCWNGHYFQNSTGHYAEFWTRDFAFCIQALLALGYKKKVLQTLTYALEKFSRAGRITTAISPQGIPFSFPDVYSPDSVALLFYCLRISKATQLVTKHRGFLQTALNKFFDVVLDPKTGLVRQHVHFSSMRDYSIRSSSCYDNSMLALLAREAKVLKFKHDYLDYPFKQKIQKHFWTGNYFRDELFGKHIAGDANLFPFWTTVFAERTMLKKAFLALQQEGIDKPLPLKYVGTRTKEKMIWLNILVPNWEKNNSWTHIGLLFAQLMKRVDVLKAREYKKKYQRIIERDGTLFELYTPKETPYKSLFYHADEGMLWAANFLTL